MPPQLSNERVNATPSPHSRKLLRPRWAHDTMKRCFISGEAQIQGFMDDPRCWRSELATTRMVAWMV